MMRFSSAWLPFFLLLDAFLTAGCRDDGQVIFVENDGGDAGDASDASDADVAAETSTTAPSETDGGVDAMTSGARCGVNGRDQCGAFAICDRSLGCVECTTDSDCPASAHACLHGTCVGCRPGTTTTSGSSDCPATTPACWASDYSCHARCTTPNDCPSNTTCDEVTGSCLGCTANTACASGVCSKELGRCIECESDSSCPSQKPRCRQLTSTCVECTSNDDCGRAAPICDPTTFTCRKGCSSDAACPGQRCDLDKASCVDVVVDAGVGDAG